MNIAQLLTQLVIPLNFAVALFLFATLLWLFKQRKHAVGAVLFGLAWAFFWSLPAASIWLGGHLENQYAYESAEDAPTADAIVVLGGHSANNRHNWFESYDANKTTSRIQRGAALYMAGKAPLILVSGAALDGGTSEAQGMARYLKSQGVPEHAILIEEQSFTTRENAYFSVKKLQEKQVKNILLVTSSLHMPRSAAVFRKAGILVTAAPVAPQITRPNDAWSMIWQPSFQALQASRSIIKEYIGLMVYWLRGWI